MFQVSPGVNFSEIDATNVTAVAATSIGAFSGQFNWGPANKRVLVDSENTLVSIFNKPDSNNFASFFSAANFLAYTNNLLLVRSISSNTLNATSNVNVQISVQNEDQWQLNYAANNILTSTYGPFVARYAGELGNSLQIAVCSNANTFKSPTIYANTIIGSNSVILSANASTMQFSVNDVLDISGVDYTISSFTGSNTVILSSNVTTPSANLIPVNLEWQYTTLFTKAPGTSIYGARQSATNDELHVAVIDITGKFSGIPGTVLEKFENVSKATDAKTDDGSPNYYKTKIFNNSKYIFSAAAFPGAANWDVPASGISFNTIPNYAITLIGGTNNTPSDSDLITSYGLFSNGDEVNVSFLISGESDQTLSNAILTLANQRRDCVAFVSPLRQDAVNSVNIDNIISYRNSLVPSTSYSFMDSGFKYQFDKYNNVYRYIPLNADMAGLCARTDTLQDPWWSPGGFNRGQILNAIKLSWNPSKAQRDILYQSNINPVVAFQGEGIVLYGDKTLQAKASAFDRINVRRLFIVLEKTISSAAKYSLFEFNDEFTRAQFIALVEPFLRDVKARRGIYDFKVVCDTTNNTPQVIDTNGFVGDIFIKPAKSINYIQLNFIAVRTGVDFTEIAG